jgi:hypothetical protein
MGKRKMGWTYPLKQGLKLSMGVVAGESIGRHLVLGLKSVLSKGLE